MKSRRKKQLARLNKQPVVQEITLQQAWGRVCEELDARNVVCWFVDQHVNGNFNHGWNIASAYGQVLIQQYDGGEN
ncbi:TPA: hypothetical protein ACGPI4_005408 [Bacillus paranthracis]